jgi:hypothetical protein
MLKRRKASSGMWRHVNRRFRRKCHSVIQLLTIFYSRGIFCTLKMESARFSEPSVLTRPTRRHVPKDGNLHSHLCENLKSYNVKMDFNTRRSSTWNWQLYERQSQPLQLLSFNYVKAFACFGPCRPSPEGAQSTMIKCLTDIIPLELINFFYTQRENHSLHLL